MQSQYQEQAEQVKRGARLSALPPIRVPNAPEPPVAVVRPTLISALYHPTTVTTQGSKAQTSVCVCVSLPDVFIHPEVVFR